MPLRLLALALFLPLIAGCTVAANAGDDPQAHVTVEQPTARPQDVVGAARFDLEAVYGADGLAEWVSSIRTMNSVLVVTMTKTPTTLSIIDEYWRVCRTLASTVTVPDIEAGKTALAVIRPNGDTVVYAVAGETSCKVV